MIKTNQCKTPAKSRLPLWNQAIRYRLYMQEHCGAAVRVFHQVNNKLWPTVKVSDTLQRPLFVVRNLLKRWRSMQTGWGGTLWQYLPVHLYIGTYPVVSTFMVCVKPGSSWSCRTWTVSKWSCTSCGNWQPPAWASTLASLAVAVRQSVPHVGMDL